MAEQPEHPDRALGGELDFVAPWADRPAVVVDLTGPEPQVIIPSASELAFVAPWGEAARDRDA